MSQRSFKLAPSILAADFAQLGNQIEAAEAAGADLIHIDIMDGQFVPNISIGPLVVAACRRVTKLPLDVHMMIIEPERFIAEVVEAGADNLTIHVEATPHLHRALQMVKEAGRSAGVALNPLTPLETVREALPYLDRLLIMSVNPGFGGQQFIEGTLERLRTARRWKEESGLSFDIEVDGGVNATTLPRVVEAGAEVIVAGSAVFGGAEGVAENTRDLLDSAR